MTLKEMSVEYRKVADTVREQLRLLRQELNTADDPEEIWHLKRKIAELMPVLTQMNELAWLLDHYYEKGGADRDDRYGFNGIRRIRKEKTARENSVFGYTRGTDGTTAADLRGIPLPEDEHFTDCKDTRHMRKFGGKNSCKSGAKSSEDYKASGSVSDSALDALFGHWNKLRRWNRK